MPPFHRQSSFDRSIVTPNFVMSPSGSGVTLACAGKSISANSFLRRISAAVVLVAVVLVPPSAYSSSSLFLFFLRSMFTLIF